MDLTKRNVTIDKIEVRGKQFLLCFLVSIPIYIRNSTIPVKFSVGLLWHEMTLT